MRLANFLADLDPSKVRTVAYVPEKARSDAAIVALACDQVVVHPRAGARRIGATTSLLPARSRTCVRVDPQGVAPAQGTLVVVDGGDDRSASRRSIAPRRPGDVEYFCDDELRRTVASRRQVGNEGEPVTTPGKPLQARRPAGRRIPLGQPRRRELRPIRASTTVWKTIRRWSSPAGPTVLIEALASPGVAVLLLVIGGGGALFRAARARHRRRRLRGRRLLPAVLLEPLPRRHRRLARSDAVPRRRRVACCWRFS